MHRLLALLLIFLLPLQVFAGMANDRLEYHAEEFHAAQHQSTQSTQSAQSTTVGADERIAAPMALLDDAAGQSTGTEDSPDSSYDDLAEDLANHATFGDETVPSGFLIFALHTPAFISSLHNDAASIPPYLPPAARPPQA